jgi:type VI secretion system protein ImpC
MAYELNLGTWRIGTAKPGTQKSGRFRIALMGDFSARANTGKLDTGATLAGRKPLKVDCDNLDATLKRLNVKLRLPLGADGGAIELTVNSLDDLHPDQLYSNLSIFTELSGLRQRLKTPSTFAKAAQQVQAWAGVSVPPRVRPRPRSVSIPANGKLSDFARLVGAPTAAPKPAVPISELLKQVVGPYVVPAKDPRQDQLVATVDSALSATMRSVLHHPDFQSFEALWRSVDLLVRRLETDEQLQIILYDVTAEELAADLSKADALDSTGLYKLLVDLPALDADQGPFAAVIGNYQFEQTPPHAELLGRMARIVAQSQTAFLAAVGTSCLDTKPADLHPLIRQAWDALAQMPEARYLGLVVPRFMLRMPYGEGTDPIDSFDFEEFTPQDGLKGLLWGNPALIAGLLLGATFSQQGAKISLGSVLSLGEMPFYYYTDSDGDQTALPCTERMLSTKMAELVNKHRFMPLLSIKGRPEVRLGGFSSLAAGPLAGPWKPVKESSPAAPESTRKTKKEEAEPAEEDSSAEPAAEAETSTEVEGATESESDAAPGVESAAETEPAAESEPTTESKETTAEAPAADPELDKLLASMNEETPPAEADADAEPEIDPDLAKLLKELG